MIRTLAALALALATGLAGAQQLEIIRLQNRSAEQVLPHLRPFLEPGGTLSGMNNQLFLRASPGNRQQLLQILSAIDRPPRRLMITVRHDGDTSGGLQGAEASGSIGSRSVRIERTPSGAAGGATVEIRRGDSVARGQVYDTRSVGSERVSQQLQVVEGGKAYINVGQSLPIPLRQMVVTPAGAIISETVVYRDLGTGFYAEPQVSGDLVTLTISPTHDTPGAYGPGSANIQRISTTVSARLGEWMTLGGVNQDAAEDSSGTLRYSTRDLRGTRRVMLKVDELP